ncbi:hypothetical protein H6G33_25470 [Calothrix sp. FACHB-1219]|uniref:hypothetical protein n=1 Tax=unclassified Calothrix TaxID=2619626 RepID=UPI001681D41F|nr:MULTISPECIES: hypothetical protein [unclassified Calothrix]MBD2208192.1 hypothetical protein [Calothrix sp. FACHB-168]MBD2220358.1 hypothetical protein [Calothrix sp. FACHB-1219]
MEPITIYLLTAIGLGLGATATVTFWHQILNWGEKNLFPWFDKHLPTIAPYLKNAFLKVNNVVTNVRRAVKNAWEKIREYLLKQVVELNRKTTSTWIQRVTSWVIEASGYNNKPVVKQITTEVEVNWDDLPPDVYEAVIKRQNSSVEKNITEMRDKELALIN